ncbi:hypothetical protein C0995_012429 [Termitomyces sp. Mi166|nr:hypothetical protein C0995_012429 [Termitomyces sp. Mi166\
MYYFRTYPGDHRLLKAFIVLLFIIEGINVAFLGQAVHFIFIVYKLPKNILLAVNADIPLGSAVSVAMTFTTATLVQSFFALRVYRLSAGNRWQKLLVAFMLVTALVQFGIGLGEELPMKFRLPDSNTQFITLVINTTEYGLPSSYTLREPVLHVGITGQDNHRY